MKGRKHQDMWTSMKTVYHFNIRIALELMLKLLLYLNKIDPTECLQGKKRHFLTRLHDAIPKKYQGQLESTFQASRSELPNDYQLIAFINALSPTPPPQPPENRNISNLRGFFEYFDEDMRWWQRRYSWDLVDQGYWHHYLSDIPVFVELVNRVMRDIERY